MLILATGDCPEYCRCLAGNRTDGGMIVSPKGYCEYYCSENVYNTGKVGQCGTNNKQKSYTGPGSVDCTGCYGMQIQAL